MRALARAIARCPMKGERAGMASLLPTASSMRRSLREAACPLALSAITACHHAPPHKPGEEWLKSIKFEGNKEISDADLLSGLALHRTLEAGQAPDPYQIQVDTDRLRGQYARAGYFEADVQARVERDRDALTVIYSIHEGKRASTRVTIAGLPKDPAVSIADVRAQLPLAIGAPFDYQVYEDSKIKLLGVLQDAGYAHAKLDAKVVEDIATHTALIQLTYTPGPKCRFGTVSVQGAGGELRAAILDRLHFTSGEVYSNRAITASQREIYGMGRFSTVQVQPDPGEGDVVDMTVAVAQSAAHQVTLGGGFGIDPISYEVRARAGYEVTGWPMPLDTFRIDLQPAYAYLRTRGSLEPRIRARARIERQDLFFTYATGYAEAGYDYLTYEAFTEYGPEARLGYEVRLGTPHLRLRVGYLIHRYGFRNPLIPPALQMEIGLDRPELVGAFEESMIADFRDHPVEPRLGIYGEIKVTEATKYAGSDYTSRQVIPELRGYVPIGPTVLAARARYGAIFGEVPPTERFYAGGATSQRGFAERALSPSVPGLVNGRMTTVPYGGAGLIDSSVELRFPLATIRKMPLGGAVFLDGGDVTERPAELDVMNLQWAAGAGLRMVTIVGPVRADIGYRLNRTGPDDPQPGSTYAFHLSLGEAF